MTELQSFQQGLVDSITKAFALALDAKVRANTGGAFHVWIAEGVSDDPSHSGTHLGPGVIDIRGSNMPRDVAWMVMVEARKLGGADWMRGPEKQYGGMVQHNHCVILDHPGLSDAARKQAGAYLAGYNGLGGNGFRGGPDYGPRDFIGCRFVGLPKPAARMAAAGVVTGWTHRVKVTPPDVLNVRSEPSATGRKIDQLEDWALVQVLERRGSWARIKGDHGETGWVSANYLEGITK